MRGKIAVIPTSQIRWLEAEGDYVRIHTLAAAYLRRGKLAELADQLDPARFVRVHRSSVVNLERIKELRPLSHGDMEAVLDDGTKVKVSRTQRAALTRLLAI